MNKIHKDKLEYLNEYFKDYNNYSIGEDIIIYTKKDLDMEKLIYKALLTFSGNYLTQEEIEDFSKMSQEEIINLKKLLKYNKLKKELDILEKEINS